MTVSVQCMGIRGFLASAAAVAVLSACGTAAAAPSVDPSPKATPATAQPAADPHWSGTHGLTAADAYAAVTDTPTSNTPAPRPYGSWDCNQPMMFHPEAGPGVNVADIYRELEYPVAYLNALGYRASIGAQLPYEFNADRPAERGSITVVVAKDRDDQYDLTTEPKVRAFSQFAQQPHNTSAALVIYEPTGLAGDIILHEVGHVLGLDHKPGSVMAATTHSPVAFDADETAAIICN